MVKRGKGMDDNNEGKRVMIEEDRAERDYESSNVYSKDDEIVNQSIQGELLDDGKVIVSSKGSIDELARRGYGYKEEGKEGYYLQMYEALYLLYNNKISIKDKNGRILTFDGLVDEALKHDNSSWIKFLIYKDLRSRGYVVREGFGFTNDFRVYDRGDYNSKAAKYVVFALNEGREVKIDTLSNMVEQISNMGKEPIMAVIERRGEVIYYKVSKMHFIDRKV